MAAPTDNQMSAAAVRTAVCAFLDIADDLLRYCYAPVQSLHMPTPTILPKADANFDGQSFTALDPRFVDMSPVRHGRGGSENVRFTVSGTLELDADLLTALSDEARFSERLVQIWEVLLGNSYEPIAAKPRYVGYMSAVNVVAEPPDDSGHARQTITLDSENYLNLISGSAPARTLLWTPDENDHAAAATTGSYGASAALGNGVNGVGY